MIMFAPIYYPYLALIHSCMHMHFLNKVGWFVFWDKFWISGWLVFWDGGSKKLLMDTIFSMHSFYAKWNKQISSNPLSSLFLPHSITFLPFLVLVMSTFCLINSLVMLSNFLCGNFINAMDIIQLGGLGMVLCGSLVNAMDTTLLGGLGWS